MACYTQCCSSETTFQECREYLKLESTKSYGRQTILTTGDGRYGYPLTVAGGSSRFLLGCQALSSTRVPEAKPVFTRLFKVCGLQKRLRTDNSMPCATATLARLSRD